MVFVMTSSAKLSLPSLNALEAALLKAKRQLKARKHRPLSFAHADALTAWHVSRTIFRYKIIEY